MCCWKKKIATVVLALAVLVPVIFPSTWVYAAPDDSSENGMTDNTWSAMDSGTKEGLYGIWGTSASDVFAVGMEGTILHYDGNAWTSTSIDFTETFYAVWGISPSNVFAVGQYWVPGCRGFGVVRHFDGSRWRAMKKDAAWPLNSVWGSYEADVFAVGEQGYILHYNGSGWSKMRSDTKERLKGVWGTSPYDVFAVGFGGTILHYDGNAWSAMDSGTKEDLFGVWGSSPSDVYAAGKVWGTSSSDVFILGGVESTVLHYDGNAWSPISVYSYIYPDSVWVWGSSAYTILHYNGDIWTAMTIGTTEGICDVWGSSSSDVFVVGGSGTIMHYPELPRPEIASIGPGQLNRGSTMDVTIIGSRFAGATAVSFGPGISVNEFTVVSSSKILVDITVSANAAAGTRDVSVTTPEGTGQLASGFEVREEREESRDSEGSEETSTSGIGLGVGWGLVALSAGIGYYLWRRNARRTRN